MGRLFWITKCSISCVTIPDFIWYSFNSKPCDAGISVNETIIGSDNGLSPVRHHYRNGDGPLSIEHMENKCNDFWIKEKETSILLNFPIKLLPIRARYGAPNVTWTFDRLPAWAYLVAHAGNLLLISHSMDKIVLHIACALPRINFTYTTYWCIPLVCTHFCCDFFCCDCVISSTLQWRHDGRDGV